MLHLLLSLLLFSFSAYGENSVLINQGDFSFNHPTCLIRFDSTQEFSKEIAKNLKNKGFKIHEFIEDKKMNPEDLYFSLLIQREGILFKDCKLRLRILQAYSVKPLEKDLLLLEAKTVREFPRVTFNGNNLCRRGIDDLFVDIPSCKSGRILKNKN